LVGRVSLENRLLLKAAGSGFELVEDLKSHVFFWWFGLDGPEP
jgi:hypothetical protein